MQRVAVALVVALAAACAGSDPPPAGDGPALEGAWATGCVTVGGRDETDERSFSGSTVTGSAVGFASSNGSCTSVVISAGWSSLFQIGARAQATLSSAPVTVWQFTMGVDPVANYNIVYVDTAASPAVTYFGDCSATAGLDCSAADKRPTVLDAARPYRRQ